MQFAISFRVPFQKTITMTVAIDVFRVFSGGSSLARY
jgi:hypothetical protein